jgi:hypothetical protein
MASISVPGSTALPGRTARPYVIPGALSRGRVAVILGVTVFLAVAIYYLVGVDEGLASLFGKSMVIHEWVHDSRHFLGFPCH